MSEGGGFGRLGYLNSKCELCLLVFNPRIGKLVDAPILGANKKAHLNCIKFLLRQAREQGHSCPKLLENGKDRQCAGCHEVKASLRCSGGGNSSPCASFFHLSCVVGSGGEINYQEDRLTCREHRTGQSKALGIRSLFFIPWKYTFRRSGILSFKMPATWPKWLRETKF